jgi:hypothetical protein
LSGLLDRAVLGSLSPDGCCDSCGQPFAPWLLDLEQLGIDLAIHDCAEREWHLHFPDEDPRQ